MSRSDETRVLARTPLTSTVTQVHLARPEGFSFFPGQRVRIGIDGHVRDYSIASGPEDPELMLCVRIFDGGAVSPVLCTDTTLDRVHIAGPFGHFRFHASPRPALFIATGTGIAPFRSMAQAGVRPRLLLFGARTAADCHYRDELRAAAESVVCCLSGGAAPASDAVSGRVTTFLADRWPAGTFDFYLCGRQEMIRDVTLLVDTRFPGSRIFAEPFY